MGACSPQPTCRPTRWLSTAPRWKERLSGRRDLAAAAPRYQISVNFPPPGDVLTGSLRRPDQHKPGTLWPHLVSGSTRCSISMAGRWRCSALRQRFADQLRLPGCCFGPCVWTCRHAAARSGGEGGVSLEADNSPLVQRSAAYALFGASQEMISLPLFYPALAVYEPGPQWGRAVGGWRPDRCAATRPSTRLLFVVTATLLSDQVPVATGTRIITHDAGEELTQHVWRQGRCANSCCT